MVVVDDDVAIDHDQGGAKPTDDGQHPGVGQGAHGLAQVVNSAAHKVALDKHGIRSQLYNITLYSFLEKP